jgi:ribose-phosphate pyrophosphokinase
VPITAPSDVIVVGNSSDDPFAIDLAFSIGQTEDIADLISMKNFANSEFCPRFISDEDDFTRIGSKLTGMTVVIVSTSNRVVSRQNLAMRNLLIARAAKENGAANVVLVEPDLYYSAQDRGPAHDLGVTKFERPQSDLKKFDGQPFTAKLYAQMLKLAGVDRVLTVHNHSYSVQAIFSDVFNGQFHNLIPYEIYTDYLRHSDLVHYGSEGEGLALCAPDQGARDFVKEMFCQLGLPRAKFILLDKERTGEREVEIKLHDESEHSFDEVRGHDIVLFDDMVRTGSTVVKSCQFRAGCARKWWYSRSSPGWPGTSAASSVCPRRKTKASIRSRCPRKTPASSARSTPAINSAGSTILRRTEYRVLRETTSDCIRKS